jgi:hypothetical protein
MDTDTPIKFTAPKAIKTTLQNNSVVIAAADDSGEFIGYHFVNPEGDETTITLSHEAIEVVSALRNALIDRDWMANNFET